MQPAAYAQRPQCDLVALGDLKIGDLFYYMHNDGHYAIHVREIFYNGVEDQYVIHCGDAGSPESTSIVGNGSREISVVRIPDNAYRM
jgi:hypothetical protein